MKSYKPTFAHPYIDTEEMDQYTFQSKWHSCFACKKLLNKYSWP